MARALHAPRRPPGHRGSVRLTRLLRRLRGRTPAELRERLGQRLAARAERHGLGRALGLADERLDRVLAAGAPRDPARLLADFRGADRPRFFPGPSDPRATAAALHARCPGHEAAILARAARILEGRFDLLGYDDLSYGRPIDWHRDPVAQRRAPLVHWSRVPYLDPAVVGDHKVVWELNRHQFLVTLGQAYAFTGDERFARGFAELVRQWMDANPPKLGINWASSLEVSFRAISWCWALHLFRHSPALTPALYGRMLGMLAVHGRHLERYLSTYFSPNTHLTGEALGLVYLGLLFPELAHAPRWLARGWGILEEWMPRHVRPDGVYFEQASQYHRYTTEFYAQLVALADANRLPLAPHVRPTLGRLFEHLLFLARPDGTIPLLGDDDGGRVVQLDDRGPHDVRALLAVGAALLGRADLAWGAADEVAPLAWLLGEEGLRRFDGLDAAPPAATSRAFSDGGLYVMRDGWARDARWSVIDCGPHGAMNCGHAHADALALEIAAGGRPLLVDAGTYTYPGPERNAFRATAAHNTLTLDDRSSSEPATPFQWGRIATCRAEAWHAEAAVDFFAGAHDGFGDPADPAPHRRELLFVRDGYWVVRDRLEAVGRHTVALRWRCAPGLQARLATADTWEVGDEHGVPVLRIVTPDGGGTASVERDWVSPAYGRREPADLCVWRGTGEGAQELVTLLLPAEQGRLAPVRRLDVTAGLGLAIAGANGEDWMLLGDGGAMACDGVRTDARWLWLRRDGAGRVAEWAAVDASRASVGDEVLLAGAERRPWAVGRVPAAVNPGMGVG